VQRRHQPVGAHNDGTFRKLIVVLLDTFEVVARRIRLPDSSRGEVHDLVPVTPDIGVQLSNTGMRPVTTNHSKDMAKPVRPKEMSGEMHA